MSKDKKIKVKCVGGPDDGTIMCITNNLDHLRIPKRLGITLIPHPARKSVKYELKLIPTLVFCGYVK